MRFSTILAVACAAVPVFGAAVPSDELALQERAAASLTALTGSVNKVSAAVKVVDDSALNVKSSALGPLLQLYSDSTNLNSTIAAQVSVVVKTPALTDSEALSLLTTVGALVSSVQKLSKDLVAIKKYATAAGVQGIVASTLKSVQTTSNTYSDALIAKAPTQKAAGLKAKSDVNVALNAAITAYSS